MALQKDTPTEFGDDDFASYWNIGEIHDDIRNGVVRIVFFGYKNAAAKSAKRTPKGAAQVELSGADYIPNITKAECYAAAKALPRFAGAADV